ncbi:MAG: ATP-binding cassette domain-containing protein [Bacilli bacterium]|nr:ATP-binding cassette domain-containing protein [Bacilli bacterium]
MSDLKARYPHSGSLFDTPEDKIAVKIEGLTKDYGKGRGIFDINFVVPEGKTFGYCGTNGAGKTTTLRHIMGFLKPQKGKVTVYGLDAWKDAEAIKPYVGYLPGEIAFPPLETGTDFLKLQAEMLGLEDMSKAEKFINALQLDPTANLKRMSKGMKQKTAMVAAFMASPKILILDEPTTGLDPLMREAFIEMIRAEKAAGTTIIMSNHMFDELEETCDYVGFIKDGKLVDIVDMDTIRERDSRNYAIRFKKKEEFEAADSSQIKIMLKDPKNLTYIFEIENYKIDGMIRELSKYDIVSIHEIPYTLERYFTEKVIKGETNGK